MLAHFSLLKLINLKVFTHLVAYGWRRYAGRANIPGTAIVALTFSCPCKCACCSSGIFQAHYKDLQMPLTVARKRLSELAALGTPRVHLTGGEPLCYNHLLEVVRMCRNLGLISFLETSACSLTLDTVRLLKTSGLSCLNVSIDSADAQGHDALRKVPGIFKQAVQAIQWSVQERLPCLVSAYATHQNIENGDLCRIISLAKDLGCLGIRIIASQPTGKWIDCRQVILSEEELCAVESMAAQSRFLILNRTRPPRCPLSRGYKVVLFPDGAVGPCEHLPFVFQDSSGMPLGDIVSKMTLLKMFRPDYLCLPRDDKFMAKEGHRCSSSRLTPVSLND